MIKGRTEWHIAKRQLRKNKLAVFGFWLLAVLYFLMIFADFIAPYDQAFSDGEKNFHPPVAIHFIDAEGHFHLTPFVYNTIERPKFSRHYLPDPSHRYPIHFFYKNTTLVEHSLLFLFPTSVHLLGVDEPARIFIFGTDDSGRDVFTRILYGSRVALTIGIIGVLVSYALGVLIGALSGYYAGKPIPLGWWKGWKPSIDVDNWIQRSGEMLLMFPSLYLLLGLRALIPEHLSSAKVYFLIVILLSFIRWPAIARVVRAMVLSIREREFVLAAEAIGCSNFRIIWRHIVPNTFSQIIVFVTLSIPSFILGEAFLSYLDLGIREPQASWGNMLTQAQDVVALTHYPWILLPGFFIFITVLGFNLLGDGLRDALDPKMRS